MELDPISVSGCANRMWLSNVSHNEIFWVKVVVEESFVNERINNWFFKTQGVYTWNKDD